LTDPADPFDEVFLRRLARLELVVRRARTAGPSGERTGMARGGRVEFRDHRRYVAGDELRTVDWNVYARLERLFVKEFAREQEVTLRLVLDASGSMGLSGKWDPARRAAAALLFVALASGYRARLVAATGETVLRDDERRGEDALPALLDVLRAVPAGGAAGPAEAIAAGGRAGGRRHALLVVSDLYETERTRAALRAVAERGREITLLQWLSRDELDPDHEGVVRLRDAERPDVLQLEVGAAERRVYRERLEAFVDGWRRFAAGHGIRHVLAAADEPLEELVLETLRRGGLLR
jgi:uncharacterized protein (DUF58 family)